MFCSQPNLVRSSGVHSTLFHTCHHQIVYVHLDFQVIFPPPYKRKVWKYKNANVSLIQRSLSLIDWTKLFHNTDVDAQVGLLNETLLNIFENFVPSKTITCNSKVPPWVNNEVKLPIASHVLFTILIVAVGKSVTESFLRQQLKTMLMWWNHLRKTIFLGLAES